MLCYVMLCYVMLCYVMLCYVMLCYVYATGVAPGQEPTPRGVQPFSGLCPPSPRRPKPTTFLSGTSKRFRMCPVLRYMFNLFVSQKRMTVSHGIFRKSNKRHLYSASSCTIWRSKDGWFDGIGQKERVHYVATGARRAQEWATKKERMPALGPQHSMQGMKSEVGSKWAENCFTCFTNLSILSINTCGENKIAPPIMR